MEQLEQGGYELCKLHGSNTNTKCGLYKRTKKKKKIVNGLFGINDLNEDVNNHLCSLNIRKKHDKSDDWSERLIIKNRLGFKLIQHDKLCANHRHMVGVGYKQSKRYQHPHHQPEIGKKAPATRPIPISRCISIAEKYNMLFPIGSVLCFNHIKNENKINKDEPPGTNVNQDYPNYETPKPVISENILNSSEAGVADLSETWDISPIEFQIKKKKVAELSEGTKYYFQIKYSEAQEKLKLTFASVAAPDQSSDFIESVIDEADISFKEDREITEDLKKLIQIYEKSDTLEKVVILSIVDHNKYSKDTIRKYFHCAKYKVDQARKLKSLADGLEIPKKLTITRSKLNIQNCEHFLDFFLTINFYKILHAVSQM